MLWPIWGFRHSPALAARRGAVAVLTSYSAQRTLLEAEARRAGVRGDCVAFSTVDAFQGYTDFDIILDHFPRTF